ncbi:MAG: hypothetical protein K2Y37_02980 [Pirellulales bacterium]|nr:hypothetical protein [Pirellulales bacterium]
MEAVIFLGLISCGIFWYFMLRSAGRAAKKAISDNPQIAMTAIKIAADMLRK